MGVHPASYILGVESLQMNVHGGAWHKKSRKQDDVRSLL